jgi:hypothetical protein
MWNWIGGIEIGIGFHVINTQYECQCVSAVLVTNIRLYLPGGLPRLGNLKDEAGLSVDALMHGRVGPGKRISPGKVSKRALKEYSYFTDRDALITVINMRKY